MRELRALCIIILSGIVSDIDLILLFVPSVDDPHLSLPHMDTVSGEEVPVANPQLEGEAAAAMRPSLTSGYSKQFQKSLPPRFLRQQVRVSTSGFTSY